MAGRLPIQKPPFITPNLCTLKAWARCLAFPLEATLVASLHNVGPNLPYSRTPLLKLNLTLILVPFPPSPIRWSIIGSLRTMDEPKSSVAKPILVPGSFRVPRRPSTTPMAVPP